MVKYMFKLSSITYKALIELIDGNQKTAAVVAEGVGRLTGLGPNLGFVVLGNPPNNNIFTCNKNRFSKCL